MVINNQNSVDVQLLVWVLLYRLQLMAIQCNLVYFAYSCCCDDLRNLFRVILGNYLVCGGIAVFFGILIWKSQKLNKEQTYEEICSNDVL